MNRRPEESLPWLGTILAIAALSLAALPKAASAAGSHGSIGGGSHSSSSHSSSSFHGGHSSTHHGGHVSHFRGGWSHSWGGGFHHRRGFFGDGFCYGCGGWYGPWWGWGWGWGWGWDPYGYTSYPYGPHGYGRSYRGEWTAVKTDVDPDEAALSLDGKLIGTADDFDGSPDMLYLQPGTYTLKFELEGFEPYSVTVDASAGSRVRIEHRLKRIPGSKHYGTYSPARPEGGIVRYFAKKDGVAVAYTPGDRERDRDSYRGRRDARAEEEMDEPAPEEEAAPEEETAPAPSEEAEAPEDSQGIAAASESRILFHVRPNDAAVYVDDKFAGTARDLNLLGAGLPVSPGEHRITVTRPGYRDKTLRVNVEEKGRSRLEVTLSH